MTWTFESILKRVEAELEFEKAKVNLILLECKEAHVQPPKDYWHNKVRLENQVKALKLLLETTK